MRVDFHYYIPDLGPVAYLARGLDDRSIMDKMLLIDYKIR